MNSSNSKNSSWTRFNKYLYKYWKLQATVIILGLVTIPFSLINPYLSKLLIDKAYANKDLKLFLILVIIGASIFVFNGLIQSLITYLSQRINRSVSFDLTKGIFKHLQSLPMSFFNNKSTSEHLYSIQGDVGSVSGFICNTIPQIITLLPRLLFILAITFYLNWRIALFTSILVPTTLIHSYFLGKWLREMTQRMIEKSQHIFNGLHEVFSHIHLVKALGKERYEIKRFEENLSKAIDLEIKNERLLNISNFSSSILNRAITGLIALYGGYQIIKGAMTLGSLTAVIAYSSQLIGLVKSIGGFYETVMVNSVSCQRVAEILDIQPQIMDREGAIALQNLEGRIEFRDVYFGYKEDESILKGLNFSIPSAAKIALVGLSGRGKTTLISLILRLYEPTQGSILIDDLDIRDIKLESLKAQIGIALQEPFLLNDSIKNNILYAKENASIDEVIEAAHIAGAHDFIFSFPKKYDTQIGENACKISEGQKQRIAIARAVINKTKILILDEAMSSLDSQTEERIIGNLKREFRDSTLIIVSHRFSTVQKMDLVYFLENPFRMEIDTHEGLLERSPRYRELFASQNKKTPEIETIFKRE